MSLAFWPFFSKPYKTRGTSPNKGEKSFFFSEAPDFENDKKNDGKIAKMAEMEISGRVSSPKIAMSF